MNILDRLEERLEGLVEGSAGALFRASLQPAEIGRKLERAMLAGQVVSVGSRIVPNEFRVGVHPDDLAGFADYAAALGRQFERWLTEVADERGWILVDRVRVTIEAEPTVRRRGVAVAATIAERSRAGRDTDEQFKPARPSARGDAAGYVPLRLRIQVGSEPEREVVLRDRSATVGRAADNAVVLADAEVSRHHAVFEWVDGGWRVRDAGSTNGTWIEGRRVDRAAIAPGDRVRVGSVVLTVLPAAPEPTGHRR